MLRTYFNKRIELYQHRSVLHNLPYILTAEDLKRLEEETGKDLTETIRVLASVAEAMHSIVCIESDGQVVIYDSLLALDETEEMQCYIFSTVTAVVVEMMQYICTFNVNEEDLKSLKKLLSML